MKLLFSGVGLPRKKPSSATECLREAYTAHDLDYYARLGVQLATLRWSDAQGLQELAARCVVRGVLTGADRPEVLRCLVPLALPTAARYRKMIERRSSFVAGTLCDEELEAIRRALAALERAHLRNPFWTRKCYWCLLTNKIRLELLQGAKKLALHRSKDRFFERLVRRHLEQRR